MLRCRRYKVELERTQQGNKYKRESSEQVSSYSTVLITHLGGFYCRGSTTRGRTDTREIEEAQ